MIKSALIAFFSLDNSNVTFVSPIVIHLKMPIAQGNQRQQQRTHSSKEHTAAKRFKVRKNLEMVRAPMLSMRWLKQLLSV